MNQSNPYLTTWRSFVRLCQSTKHRDPRSSYIHYWVGLKIVGLLSQVTAYLITWKETCFFKPLWVICKLLRVNVIIWPSVTFKTWHLFHDYIVNFLFKITWNIIWSVMEGQQSLANQTNNLSSFDYCGLYTDGTDDIFSNKINLWLVYNLKINYLVGLQALIFQTIYVLEVCCFLVCKPPYCLSSNMEPVQGLPCQALCCEGWKFSVLSKQYHFC